MMLEIEAMARPKAGASVLSNALDVTLAYASYYFTMKPQ
jgi:hypothetical protein